MKTQIISIAAKFRSATLTVVALGLLSAGSASAMGINGLLGVQPGFPQIDGTSGPGQGATGTPIGGGFSLINIVSTPTLYFPDADTLSFVNDGLFSISGIFGPDAVDVGAFSITGGTTTTGLTSPLLFGDIIEYGIENTSSNPGGTDRMDFLLNPLGGSLLTDPNWSAGSLVGISMTLEGSTFNGSFDELWEANRVKFILGPVAVTEPAVLPLMFLALSVILLVTRRTATARK